MAEKTPGVRELLDKYDLRPRKGLGQHFLADPNILRKIVVAAELSPDAVVLEIGPGLGTLTRQLAQVAGRVVAVELDEGMVGLLRQELAHLPNLEVVQGDILKLDPAALMRGSPSTHLSSTPAYTVVANLPYYITSAAVRHLLEADPPPQRLALTVQREVAERIVAGPGDMSLLAVSVQFYGRPRIAARIPAGAFIPPPRVDSALVRIDTYDTSPVQVPDSESFFRVVRAGFGQKRKQLKNALAAGLGLSGVEVGRALERAGVDPRRRAQTLTLEEWASLACEFSPQCPVP
jgi:16S rRNA (adenine1518-N6/adenine1519-N6)-dimethyltransferase